MNNKKTDFNKPYFIENKNSLTYVKEDCTLDLEVIDFGVKLYE